MVHRYIVWKNDRSSLMPEIFGLLRRAWRKLNSSHRLSICAWFAKFPYPFRTKFNIKFYRQETPNSLCCRYFFCTCNEVESGTSWTSLSLLVQELFAPVSHKFKRLKNFEFFKPLDPTALNETAHQYNDNRLTFSSIFYLLILKITLKLLLDAHQLGPELKLNENMVFLKFNKYLSLSLLQNPLVKNFDSYHIHFVILIKIGENSLIMV